MHKVTPLRQKGQTCMITALAMLLELEPDYIARMLGKDGSPGQDLHIQELQDFLIHRGSPIYEVEYSPYLPFGPVYSPEKCEQRFKAAILGKRALLYVRGHGARHMLAWDGEQVFDPATGTVGDLSQYSIIYSAYILGGIL